MDTDMLDRRRSLRTLSGFGAESRSTVMKAGRHRFSKRSTSTVDTTIMVAVTGDIVGVIAEAAMCPFRQPARAPAAPAQAETADLTNDQNV